MTEKISGIVIWAYMGGLFGALLGGLYAVVQAWEIAPWLAILPAAGLAGGAMAAFSAALRIGIIGFFLGIASGLVAIVMAGTGLEPLLYALIGIFIAGISLAISAVFMPFPNSMLTRALTGLAVGSASAAILLVVQLPFANPVVFLFGAALITLLASLAYRLSIKRITSFWTRHTPATVAAALTAGGFGGMGALSMWAIAIGIDPEANQALATLAIEALKLVIFGAIGGVLGGMISGLIGLLRPIRSIAAPRP